jgi:hypothetical protein
VTTDKKCSKLAWRHVVACWLVVEDSITTFMSYLWFVAHTIMVLGGPCLVVASSNWRCAHGRVCAGAHPFWGIVTIVHPYPLLEPILVEEHCECFLTW